VGLRERLLGQVRQGSAFLVVGGVAFVVDAVTYNLLVFGIGSGGPLRWYPLPAKILAIAVASAVTFLGNRYLTFRSRQTPTTVRQLVVFVLLNGVAALLQLACLGFSRYVLHASSQLADNISGTLIGQAVATIFRYVTYDRWVFPHARSPTVTGEPADLSRLDSAPEADPEDLR
jgi:putative flippase GtrA